MTTIPPASMRSLHMALEHAQRGDGARALLALAGVPPQVMAHPDALVVQSEALRAAGRTDAARAALEAAVSAAPDRADIWNMLGRLLGAAGLTADATRAYRSAAECAPAVAEHWINLGLAAIDSAELALAEQALDRAVSLRPRDPGARAAKGLLAQALGQPQDAVVAYSAALAARPKDAATWHNLATAERSLGRNDAALEAVEQAMLQGEVASDTATLRAHILADVGRFDDAVAQYAAVIRARPDHLFAQDALSALLPQIGRKPEALNGYRTALRGPASPALWSAALAAARAMEDGETMLAWADAAEAAHGPAPDWRLARINALSLMDDRAAALAVSEQAVAEYPALAGAQTWRAWLLLQAGDAATAEGHALAATRIAPDDQSPWSLLTLIWRLLGDRREAWLADYDRLVMTGDIATPAGYRDLPAFLADAAEKLSGLHRTRAAPADQSLRGGTQTRGALFALHHPVLQALQSALLERVDTLLSDLPDDPTHPFLRRRANRVRMTGSWSVRLGAQGFHISHMHPSGWLSSAFYVALPPEIAGSETAGALQFGVPEARLGLHLTPRRIVPPMEGRLVLFPSYVWHGTAPFESSSPRLTVAFDAVPVQPC